ncbi:GNAT family N-acetyltransferase [Colwellia psychrerythraea]|uniref:GCN5-related N-acetyltransferase n=1 Tax=Colwellia psychrerythraea TaxID=28229 RepID=A0A099KFC0_COLPS|nr:GNAT family N-acetyltransferase [Colwellia psychrerythraea]KGJ88990.1 GCN5-related N-acetyltransferase [Colwellia psychrerythraea]
MRSKHGIPDNHENLIGFTRVIIDFTFKDIIFDVIVTLESSGKGLGQQLMNLLKSHQAVKHFKLYCLPDTESFYADLGFSTDVGGIKLMRCIND